MNFPTNLLYTKDHEWILIEGETATIGVTDFAQKELGDIVYVDISKLNQTVEKHGIFGSIEAVKTVSDLFSPIKCEITEVNPNLTDAPEKVNSDPYGAGWIVKVKVIGEVDSSDLMDSVKYQASLNL